MTQCDRPGCGKEIHPLGWYRHQKKHKNADKRAKLEAEQMKDRLGGSEAVNPETRLEHTLSHDTVRGVV